MSDDQASKKLTVSSQLDWEIWVIQWKTSFTWKLPVKLKPYKTQDGEDIFYIPRTCSGGLTGAQFTALSAVLDAWNVSSNGSRGWWIYKDTFSTFAERAQGITMERYVVWPGAEPYVHYDTEESEIETNTGFSPGEIQFLKSVYHGLGSPSWEAFKIIWLRVRHEVIRRLAVERKEVDLGFVRLIPLGYRQNWKEILAVRFSHVLSLFGLKDQETKMNLLVQAGFYPALTSTGLLAIDKERHFLRWTIETIPGPDLERSQEEHEYARLQTIGAVRYAQQIINCIASSLPVIMDIFSRYIVKVTVPTARLMNGYFGSHTDDGKTPATQNRAQCLKPAIEKGCVRPQKGLCPELPLCADDAMTSFHQDNRSNRLPPGPPPSRPMLLSEPKDDWKVPVPELLKTVPAFQKMLRNGKGRFTRDRSEMSVIDVQSEPVERTRAKTSDILHHSQPMPESGKDALPQHGPGGANLERNGT